jgi:predicted nucleotidyltransferase
MKRKDIKGKIKAFFLQNPTQKLRVRQIERTVQVPLPSVSRYTRELEQEKILKRWEGAGITAFEADRSSKEYLIEKKCFNLKALHQSGITDFLIQELNNPTILAFGSYVRGEDVEKSDIDLYIETPSQRKISVEKFERKLQRKIHLIMQRTIKNIQNKELVNNIVNGITLNGFLEVST